MVMIASVMVYILGCAGNPILRYLIHTQEHLDKEDEIIVNLWNLVVES